MSDENQLVPASVNPAELEEAMLTNDKAMGTPADIAAVFFQRNYPRLKYLLGHLSRRSLERAVICAAAFPLVPEGLKPKNKEESELAWVLEQMISCKVTMISQMELHKLNNVEELEAKNKNNESLTKGEEVNG